MAHKIDITIDVEKLKEQSILPEILQVLKVVRPRWKQAHVRSKEFTGGISNHLYGYYIDGEFHEDVVLFRMEEEGKELMVDKNRERRNMQILYDARCGPPLYAVFNNGIVYGYIQGETASPDTVRHPEVRKMIAKEMSRLHAIRPYELTPDSPSFKVLSFRLLELSPDGFPDDPEKDERYKKLLPPKHKLREELEQLWDHVEALGSPTVFCHNDLLPNNIIYNKRKGTVHFIDFEFAMYNYEHYEIACHFCEYIGTADIDVTRYPDKPYQLDWIRYFLQCKAEQDGGSVDDVTELGVEDCYVKINKFALVAHFICGLWSLAQCRLSSLDFDFLGYGSLRLGQYFAKKDEFLGLQLPS